LQHHSYLWAIDICDQIFLYTQTGVAQIRLQPIYIQSLPNVDRQRPCLPFDPVLAGLLGINKPHGRK